MKIFRLVIVLVLALALFAPVMAQTGRNNAVVVPTFGGALSYISPVKDRTDSTTFKDSFYFKIPEGVRTDSLMLLIWAHSADGAAHLKISKFDGMYIDPGAGRKPTADNFKGSADSVVVSSDFSTESSLKALLVVQNAKDSTATATNTGSAMLAPTAMRVNVMGTTSNRTDTRYAIQLIARKFTNSL